MNTYKLFGENLTELQKALDAHACKPWVTKLLIVPHTVLTENVTFAYLEDVNDSQLNASIVKKYGSTSKLRIGQVKWSPIQKV